MRSPFSEFEAPERTVSLFKENTQAFESPLLDPKEAVRKESSYRDAAANGYVDVANEGITGWRTEVTISPQMEGELSDAQLANAMALNAAYMVSLGWANHLDVIIDKLNSLVHIYARAPFTRDIKYDLLARAIDRYQIDRHLNPPNKGVMAIDTWAALQDDLGFLDVKYVRINIEKAKNANQKLKDQLWGKHINYILKYFVKQRIIKYELPLDGKYFALAVAKWQSINDNVKNVPNGIDGILGKFSWDILRTELESFFPGYEVKAHVQLGNTAEAARRYVAVMEKLGSKLKDNFDAVENKVSAALRNEKMPSSLFREGVYLVANAILDIVGEAGPVKVLSAFGQVGLGLIKKYYEEKEEDARKAANLSITSSLSDIVLMAKNAATYLPDQTVIQHQFEDKLRSLKQNRSSAEGKKLEKEEFERFVNYLVELEETVRDDRKIMRIAISKLMNLYSMHARIIVHCQNDEKAIEEWNQEDLYSIITDPDRKRLFFRFTNVHPQIDTADSLLNSNQHKILKDLWTIWNEYGFPLKQLSMDKDVFLRVNFPRAMGSWITSIAGWVAFDVYVKTIKKDETSWIDSTDIQGRSGGNIRFYNGNELKMKGLDEANKKGITYRNIILNIVNKVMQNEYNTGINSTKVGFVESEIPDEIDQEIYGSYEAADSQQETAALVEKQPTPAFSSFLTVANSNKATAANKAGISKSGLSLAVIWAALDKYADTSSIRKTLLDHNQKNPGNAYAIDASGTTADAVFTETIHQFQLANYIDPRRHNGLLGRSVLDTLGFTEHGLKEKLNSKSFYGQTQLDRKDVKDEIPKHTDGKFTSANWYNYLQKPAWLGVIIADGVHSLLLSKLREAEAWLLNQPQYKGMTPAALGRALGFDENTRYSGARLSASKQAMHGFGLAIDINVNGNPWIGAGWIVNDKVLLQERYRMIGAFRKASGNSSLPGDTVFAYLDSIARSTGADTAKSYAVLKQRSSEFIAYLKSNPTELAYWKASQTFGNRNPLKGFLNLHPDLVYALRQVAGLAWGAIDFGPRASGDIMHFDLRTIGLGKILCQKIGGFVPKSGHPTIEKEVNAEQLFYEEFVDHEMIDGSELHEAVEEVWSDESTLSENLLSSEDREADMHDHEAFAEDLVYEDEYNAEEHEAIAANWSRAVNMNRQYGASLGWNQYITSINELLLPYSGLQDQSLGEEAFAQAVASWQQHQGFATKDADGIIGPHTWSIMEPMLTNDVQPVVNVDSNVPSVQQVFEFNKWHAQKVLDSMSSGVTGQNFNSKMQLEKIVRGEKVLNVDPQTRIIQVLPLMYHICEQARNDNYKEIIFGSFIRGADDNGSCTGHCAGRCIDINHNKGSFESGESTQMVIRILQYLTTMPAQYKQKLGFGMPLQGEFFGHRNLNKFKSLPASNLVNSELKKLVPTLGIVFPDNNNHLHIQVGWLK